MIPTLACLLSKFFVVLLKREKVDAKCDGRTDGQTRVLKYMTAALALLHIDVE